jgi:hypothetical protein
MGRHFVSAWNGRIAQQQKLPQPRDFHPPIACRKSLPQSFGDLQERQLSAAPLEVLAADLRNIEGKLQVPAAIELIRPRRSERAPALRRTLGAI